MKIQKSLFFDNGKWFTDIYNPCLISNIRNCFMNIRLVIMNIFHSGTFQIHLGIFVNHGYLLFVYVLSKRKI